MRTGPESKLAQTLSCRYQTPNGGPEPLCKPQKIRGTYRRERASRSQFQQQVFFGGVETRVRA